jgi:hypothetical protein
MKLVELIIYTKSGTLESTGKGPEVMFLPVAVYERFSSLWKEHKWSVLENRQLLRILAYWAASWILQFTKYCYCDQMKEDKMLWACST